MLALLLSNDLAVLSRVEGAAARCGIGIRQVASVSRMLEPLVAESVKLAIVDLSLPSIDICTIVKHFKQNDASGVRVIAFGPHVHVERLEMARDAGCDRVLSRGEFFAQLDKVLQDA